MCPGKPWWASSPKTGQRCSLSSPAVPLRSALALRPLLRQTASKVFAFVCVNTSPVPQAYVLRAGAQQSTSRPRPPEPHLQRPRGASGHGTICAGRSQPRRRVAPRGRGTSPPQQGTRRPAPGSGKDAVRAGQRGSRGNPNTRRAVRPRSGRGRIALPHRPARDTHSARNERRGAVQVPVYFSSAVQAFLNLLASSSPASLPPAFLLAWLHLMTNE